MFGYSFTARILFLALFVLVLWGLFARSSGAAGPEVTYTVRAGDTLWSIATDVYGGDPREGVWKIAEQNRLDGARIVPGQVLTIP